MSFENGNGMNGNVMNNGVAGGYYNQPMPGMQGTGWNWNPQQPTQQPRQYSFLSADEMKILTDKGTGFSLKLTQEEKLRAICNHRTPDGTTDTLEDNPDGSVRCRICGYQFEPINTDEIGVEEVRLSSKRLVDVLQTIKILYIDLDPQIARDYFQIIPLIEKIPALYEMAISNYSKHEQYNPYRYDNRNMGTARMFEALSNIFNGGMSTPQQPAQPMQAQPNPMYQGQPMGGFPMQQPMSNGFGYQPQGYGFQYNPQQPMQAQPNPAFQQGYPAQAAPMGNVAATVTADPVAQPPVVEAPKTESKTVKG